MILAFAFLVLSIVFFLPHNDNTVTMVRSSELSKVVTRDGDTERTEYMDEKGKITFASDVGYAIMTITETEKGRIEKYFDADGKAIPYKSNTYYAVLREYDKHGNNIKYTFLDFDEKPVLVNYGYASVFRTFTDEGKVVSEKYYDIDGNPVCSTVFGYGKLNKYDEDGHTIQQTYVDENGNPMVSGLGYATVRYNYYDTDDSMKGKVESEFYFGVNSEPIRLSFGQYGVHKEYDENGQNSVQTYLDAAGNPVMTTKGYATIVRTFFANNTVATEKYYDADGNPVKLSEGQYGLSHKGGKNSYLDVKGNRQFNIKRLLFNQQYLVILAAIVVMVVSTILDWKGNLLLLLMYFGFIIYVTLMFRGTGESKTNMELLWAYRQAFTSSEARSDVLNNIWLFIPLGAIFYKLYPKKIILLVPILLSLLIEITQYLTGRGLCELDDIVSNGLGGCIGFGTGLIVEEYLKKWMVLRVGSRAQ